MMASAESDVDSFKRLLGPFVVAAEKTRMAMVFTNARTPENLIVFANASFLELSGYESKDVLGESLYALMAPDTDPDAGTNWPLHSRAQLKGTRRSITVARTAANSGHRCSSARCWMQAARSSSISFL